MSMIGNFLMINEERYKKLMSNPDEITNFLYEEEKPDASYLDIDKTWHAIHFLLTGDTFEGDPPASDVILGGITIGTVDVGYGPARVITNEEVKNVSEYLKTINTDTLLEKYNADKLNEMEIYSGWQDSPEDHEYIKDYFNELIVFYEKAAENNFYVIQYIN